MMDRGDLSQSKSLFPAYQSDFINSPCDNNFPSTSGNNQFTWLDNESFTKENIEALHSISDEERFNKSQKLLKNACVKRIESGTQREFFVDIRPDNTNLSTKYMYPEHVAFYNQCYHFPLGFNSKNPKCLFLGDKCHSKKFKCTKRYFTKVNVHNMKCKMDLSLQKFQNVSYVMKNYIPLQESEVSAMQSSNPFSKKCELSGTSKRKTLFDNILDTVHEQYLHEQIQYFNKALQDNPKNEDMWIKFLDLQDEIFSEQNCKSDIAKHHNKLIIDKKLAILDKALATNPNSVALSVARLELTQNMQEVNSLLQQWEKLLSYHPHNCLLWQKYIFFVQCHLSHFTVSQTVDVFIKALKTLTGEKFSSSSSYILEENLTDIFVHLCIFLHHSGYTERAIATFQALIEFNLYPPCNIKSSQYSSLLAFFEPFWDSGVPRFGEENAIGWGKFMEVKQWTSMSTSYDWSDEINAKENEIVKKKLSTAVTLWKLEMLYEDYFWLPWRPNVMNQESENSCEDPERMVLIDDVSKTLFLLTSEKAKFHLILKFLQFLGVPIHSEPCTLFNRQFFVGALHYVDILSSNSFSTTSYIAGMELGSLLYTCYSAKGKTSFINRIFQQAVSLFSLPYRKLLEFTWLKFMIEYLKIKGEKNLTPKSNYKEARKLAKNLLKEEHNRNNLLLWTEYGVLEWLAGNKNEARNAYETILSTFTPNEIPSSESGQSLWKLVKTFIELESGIYDCYSDSFKNNEAISDINSRVIWILTHAVSEEKYVPFISMSESYSPKLLKARNNFKKIFHKSLCHLSDDSDYECMCFNSYINFLIDFASCYMYLQYFSNGMLSAREVFEDLLECMKIKSLSTPLLSRICLKIEETIFMIYVKLIKFHMLQNNKSRTYLHSVLQTALIKYPFNSTLLHCFLELETGSLITGYFSRFYLKLLNQRPTSHPILWLFAIFAELKRYSYICSVSHVTGTLLSDYTNTPGSVVAWKIRHLFEKACKSPSSQHCIPLWRLYIMFEVLMKDINRAKGVFYQAVQKCPWAKILYVDGLHHFSEDLQQILDIMTEKELRIHKPIEEVIMLINNTSDETEMI